VSVTGQTYLVGAEQLRRVRLDLDKLVSALASVATDKLRVSVVDALPESPFNLAKVAGTALTGRDWSQDFARLQNLDVALSSRASEATLTAIRDRLPSSLTAAGNFRVAVSEDAVGIARDSTLSGIKSQTDFQLHVLDSYLVCSETATPWSPFQLHVLDSSLLAGSRLELRL